MKAYEVLEKYDWCQGHYALADDGSPIGALSSRACHFCAAGAIMKAYNFTVDDYMQSMQQRKFHSAIPTIFSISGWNDQEGRTKEEVIAKLKELNL